jgi:DNA-binding NarL/FixJ family response regulator
MTRINRKTMEGKPLRVLIVEDSQDDALLLLAELRRKGFAPQYEIVESEPAYLDALRSREWDLIVSDFAMPNFDGLKAFDLLSAQGLDVPFIFVSGHIGEERAADAMLRGASDYVLKDNLTRLVPAVERELREAVERRARRAAERALAATELRQASPTDSTLKELGLQAVHELLQALQEFVAKMPPRPGSDPLPATGSAAAVWKGDPSNDRLSKRQFQVLRYIAEGKSTQEIATILGVTAKTVGAHRWRLMEKLNIHDTAGLVRYAIRRGMIKP